MKLEREVYPDFYAERENIIKENIPDLFTGRKESLRRFWDGLAFHATGNHPDNLAIIAQRKAGKTALLARLYNVAFWEQEEIMPLYFAFEEEELYHYKALSHQLMFTFARQAVGFALKRPDIAKMNEKENFLEFLGTVKETWAKNLFDAITKIYSKIIETDLEALKEILSSFLSYLSQLFKKRCMLVMDEMQELARGIVREEEVPDLINVPCDIDKYRLKCQMYVLRIMKNADFWVLLSGSAVSVLVNEALTSALKNRCGMANVPPLSKEETMELVNKIARKNGIEGYEGLAEDVYELVGGIPWHSHILFEKNPLAPFSKNFGSKEGLMSVYSFEMFRKKGKFYEFWWDHFQKNIHHLNHENLEERKITIQILYYIAQCKNLTDENGFERDVYLYDIAENFPKVDKEKIRQKLDRLENSDFIRVGLRLAENFHIEGFNNEILPVLMVNMFAEELLENPTPEKQKEMIEEMRRYSMRDEIMTPKRIIQLEKRMDAMQKVIRGQRKQIKRVRKNVGTINQVVQDVESKHDDLQKDVGKIGSRVKKQTKKIAVVQEDVEKIERKGKKEKGLENFVRGTVYQNEIQSKKEVVLVMETKKRKSRVSGKDAEKFVSLLQLVARKNKGRKLLAIYTDHNGSFSQSAVEILKENKVRYGKFQDILNEKANKS